MCCSGQIGSEQLLVAMQDLRPALQAGASDMPAPFEVPARRAHPCSSVCAAPRLDAPPPKWLKGQPISSQAVQSPRLRHLSWAAL